MHGKMRWKQRIAWGALGAASAGVLALNAWPYRMVCDDAYISVRYAQNLWQHGALVYNLGERVEGYSNLLMVLLYALGLSLGLEAEQTSLAVGVASAWLLGASLGAMVWGSLGRGRARAAWACGAALSAALSGPLAAWLFSGLETVLFASWLACAGELTRRALAAPRAASWRAGAWAGLAFGLAGLTRPEGAAFALWAAVLCVALRGGDWRSRWQGGAGLLLATAAWLVPHLLFRRAYYGEWLPNTYYLKTTGDAAVLAQNGLQYLRLAYQDLGPQAPLWLALLAVPVARLGGGAGLRARRFVVWFARGACALVAFELCQSGGDFFGMWRFLVAPLALSAPAVGLGVVHLWGWVTRFLVRARAAPRPVWVAWAVASALCAVPASQLAPLEHRWNEPSVKLPGPLKRARLEEMHWSRFYAQRWLAQGHALRRLAEPGDSLAHGAAGATVYGSGLPNLDLFGLCDVYVARHGDFVGHRPGHQRRAPLRYVLQKAPTFLFWGDSMHERSEPPPRDPTWERRGYVWLELFVPSAQRGQPDDYYVTFLVRKERAASVRGREGVRLPAAW